MSYLYTKKEYFDHMNCSILKFDRFSQSSIFCCTFISDINVAETQLKCNKGVIGDSSSK